MSGGEIAGIALGSIAGVAILGGIALGVSKQTGGRAGAAADTEEGSQKLIDDV